MFTVFTDQRKHAEQISKGFELPEADANILGRFVPPDRLAYELFKSRGITPAGYMTQKEVADLCTSCGEEMKKANVPLISESYFTDLIGIRVASDLHQNTEKWAKAIADEGIVPLIKAIVPDADDYDLSKARNPKLVKKVITDKRGKRTTNSDLDLSKATLGEPYGLVDLLKAHPAAAIQGWAEKMKAEGGDHPFSWCQKKATFAADPDAFCAAVHMAAFGKTPSQRASGK